MTRIFFLILHTILITIDSLYVIKPTQPIKYIQGLHFNSGHLYYGTNNGYVVSVTRKDNDVVTKWYQKISTRNIKSIDSFDKQLLIDCDATNYEETSRTFICSDEGDVIDSCSWKDTTIVQGISQKNWVRCNTKGFIESKDIFNENIFKHRYKIPLLGEDYLTCGVVKNDMLYTMSIDGQFTIVDTQTFKIVWRQFTRFKLSTCINTYEPLGQNSSFTYIGNRKGEIYFIQLTDGNKISSTMKQLHNVPMTNIYIMNGHGPLCYFIDSTIQGLKFISFESFINMKLDENNSPNSFALSSQGIFTIKNQNEIVLHNLNLI